MKKKIAFIISSLGGIGYAPVASGTVASFATIFIAGLIAYFYGTAGLILAVMISFFLGTYTTKIVLQYTPHDPSLVVIDEFAGQTLSYVLVGSVLQEQLTSSCVILYLLGFAFFRLYDITKPLLAGWADKRVLNAWGVMLDDIFAGLFASLSLWICWWVFFH